MTKYYTPHDDEFHNGFIYERLTEEGWSERIVSLSNENEDVSVFRVRILSPDDIMSIGFNLFAEEVNKVYVFRKVVDSLEYPRVLTLTAEYRGDFPFITLDIDGDILIKNILVQNKNEFQFLISRLCL